MGEGHGTWWYLKSLKKSPTWWPGQVEPGKKCDEGQVDSNSFKQWDSCAPICDSAKTSTAGGKGLQTDVSKKLSPPAKVCITK